MHRHKSDLAILILGMGTINLLVPDYTRLMIFVLYGNDVQDVTDTLDCLQTRQFLNGIVGG